MLAGPNLLLTQKNIFYSMAAIVACIGTGLPTDILITTAVALTAGGLPLDDIGIIIAVDWIL